MPSAARILLVVPANNTTMEGELRQLFPPATRLWVAGVKRPARTLLAEDLPAYAEATIASVEPFAGEKFDLVVYGCTAAGFLAGPVGNGRIAAKLAEATGAKVVSTAEAMVAALKTNGVTSTAVVTPYLEPVNDGLRRYLEASGIRVEVLASFLCKTTDELGKISEAQVSELALATVTPNSAALFIACSQLPTLGIIDALHRQLGIPVSSSIAATAAEGARQLAADGFDFSRAQAA